MQTFRLLLLCLGAVFISPAIADDARSGPLFDELAEMDRVLFTAAFVDCDAEKFRELFTDDAEFYHDLVGPMYGDDARRLNGCPRDNGVRRILVEDSLEVYPIKDYGAVQMGEHWFVEEGAENSTIAKFVNLWRRVDGEWRLARVLSIDHQSVPADSRH